MTATIETQHRGGRDRRRPSTRSTRATGDVVGTHPVAHRGRRATPRSPRAREAAAWWAALSFDERAEHLLDRGRGVITRRIAQLADLMHQETGKPHGDAHARGRARHRPPRLGGRARREGARRPQGPVRAADGQPGGDRGVPPARRRRRDRPVELPGLHADGLDRLRAGGRQRRGVQAQRVHPRRRRSGWPTRSPRSCPSRPVLQVVTGLGETGAALCRAGVDKVAFTGSDRDRQEGDGRLRRDPDPGASSRPAARTRCIVDEDADLDAAADAALWGGCPTPARPASASSGSTCTSGSTTSSSPSSLDKAKELRADAGPDAKIGPITMPKQLDVIRSHIDDALARGGRAVLGGAGRGRRALRAADDPGRRARGLRGGAARRPSARR